MGDQINPTSLEPEVQLPIPEELKEGAVAKEVEGAGDEVKKEGGVEAPTERMFSQAEWDKRQSSIDTAHKKELANIQEKSATKAREQAEALETAQLQIEEAETKAFLRMVEEQGGDMDSAKAIAKARTDAATEGRRLQMLKAELEAERETLTIAGKAKKAHDLVKEHGLDEDALDGLLEAENPDQMEAKALRLRLEKSKTEERPSTKTAAGRGSTKGGDLSGSPPSIVLGTLMEAEEEARK